MKTVQKIEDYHGNSYLVNLEEDEKDIFWAVKYKDHGDDFVLVCTNDDKIYCYGWWEDRYHFDSSIRKHKLFAKKTTPYRNPFKGSHGVGITWNLEYIINNYLSENNKPSKVFCQRTFNEVIENLIFAFDTGYEYDWTEYKDGIKKFLEVNDLDTEKNLSALEKAPWTSLRIDGCIGIAAKEDWSTKTSFVCDRILSVFYDNQWHRYSYKHPRRLPVNKTTWDEYGFDSDVYLFSEIQNHFSQLVLF